MASASTVRGYVYALISIFPGFLQTPARWVADRVFGIWTEVAEYLVQMRTGFKYLLARAYRYVQAFWRFANEAAVTVRWLVSLFVPRWAKWALNAAMDWARGEVARIRGILTGIVNTLRTWTQNAVSSLDRLINNVRNWVTQRLQELWGRVNSLSSRVVALLTSPDAFVNWVFAALWRRLWRYLDDHLEAVAASVWARRDALMMQTLARIEAFLMRVL